MSRPFPENAGEGNPPCPWLPGIGRQTYDFNITRRHGGAKGPEFYQDALCYAQAQWCAGKPAQAILQLNKSWMADLTGDEAVLTLHPPPYRALIWILRAVADDARGFMGNPVRHFQHLASRMSGPRAEIRSWRAWLCFYLAAGVLDASRFPRDGVQIAREGLWIPGPLRAFNEVTANGWHGETAMLEFRGGSIGAREPVDATFEEL